MLINKPMNSMYRLIKQIVMPVLKQSMLLKVQAKKSTGHDWNNSTEIKHQARNPNSVGLHPGQVHHFWLINWNHRPKFNVKPQLSLQHRWSPTLAKSKSGTSTRRTTIQFLKVSLRPQSNATSVWLPLVKSLKRKNSVVGHKNFLKMARCQLKLLRAPMLNRQKDNNIVTRWCEKVPLDRLDILSLLIAMIYQWQLKELLVSWGTRAGWCRWVWRTRIMFEKWTEAKTLIRCNGTLICKRMIPLTQK